MVELQAFVGSEAFAVGPMAFEKSYRMVELSREKIEEKAFVVALAFVVTLAFEGPYRKVGMRKENPEALAFVVEP